MRGARNLLEKAFQQGFHHVQLEVFANVKVVWRNALVEGVCHQRQGQRVPVGEGHDGVKLIGGHAAPRQVLAALAGVQVS